MRLKTRYVMIAGALLAILPYLGIPVFWKRIFMTILSVLVILFAYLIYRSFRGLRLKYHSLEQTHRQAQPVSSAPEHHQEVQP